MTSVGHGIVVMSTFQSLIEHRGIMKGAACGPGNAYPSGAPGSPLVFIEVHVVLSCVSPYFMSCLFDFGF